MSTVTGKYFRDGNNNEQAKTYCAYLSQIGSDTAPAVMFVSLVVEHDVREPDVGGGHVEAVHAPVLLGVPAELVVKPVLLDPEVSRHHLLPEVLGWRHF